VAPQINWDRRKQRVMIHGRWWPAQIRTRGVLLDLRTWSEGDAPALVFDAGRLASYRVPFEMVRAAAASEPVGLVLLTADLGGRK
jgi:hypothetical protein